MFWRGWFRAAGPERPYFVVWWVPGRDGPPNGRRHASRWDAERHRLALRSALRPPEAVIVRAWTLEDAWLEAERRRASRLF